MLDWHDLNTRHVALFIWMSLFVAFVTVRSSDLRNTLHNLMTSVLSRPLLPTLLGFFGVAGASTYCAVLLGTWASYWVALPVVTAVVWTMGSGIGLLLNYGRFVQREETFSRTVARTLLPSAIITALVGSSTLSLGLELVLVPVAFAVGGVHIVALSNPEYRRATYVTTPLFVLYTVGLLALLVRASFSDPDNLKLASQSVILPVWLTVWAVPYLRLLIAVEKATFRLSARCKPIRRSDYGDAWPLTVERAWLYCRARAVWVEVGRTKYALNGTSQTVLPRYGLEFLELEEIWREDPMWEGIREQVGDEAGRTPLRVDIGGLIREGLALEEDG